MTAEKLHDAITLLPGDLIAEADVFRNQKAAAKPIPWSRYLAMAACFAVVLSCSLFAARLFAPKGATESAMQDAAEAPAAAAPAYGDAPAEEAAPEEFSNGSTSGSGTITEDSLCELPAAEPEASARDASAISCQRVETPLKPSAACFSSSAMVTLIHSPEELETYLSEKDWIYDFTDFPAACEYYDENWFAEHDLLLLTIHAAYPDVPYTVTAIEDVRGVDPLGWDWFVYFSNRGTDDPDQELTVFHLLTELEKGLISPEDSILSIAEVPSGS